MNYLLHALLAFLATTSVQHSNADIKQDIKNVCESWYNQPHNSALIQKIVSPEADQISSIDETDLEALLYLVTQVEQLEKKLILSGLSSVEARQEAFTIFSIVLCNHLLDDQRISLKKLLEIDNKEVDQQLEEAVSLLVLSSKTNKEFYIQAQPEAQYFLFMHCLRKELATK